MLRIGTKRLEGQYFGGAKQASILSWTDEVFWSAQLIGTSGQTSTRRKVKLMNEAQISEIVALAWDDETTFDAIKRQFGLSEDEVIKLMRLNMKPSSFRMWRKRVSGRKTKHEAHSKK